MRGPLIVAMVLAALQFVGGVGYKYTIGLATAEWTGEVFREGHDAWWMSHDDARESAIRLTGEDPVSGASGDAVAAEASRQDAAMSTVVRSRLITGAVIVSALAGFGLGRLREADRARPLTLLWPVVVGVVCVCVAAAQVALMSADLKGAYDEVSDINKAFTEHWKRSWQSTGFWAAENAAFRSLVEGGSYRDLFWPVSWRHARATSTMGHVVSGVNLVLALALCAVIWRNEKRRTNAGAPAPEPTQATDAAC